MSPSGFCLFVAAVLAASSQQAIFVYALFEPQSVVVSGHVVCAIPLNQNDNSYMIAPAPFAKVELIESDTLTADDVLNTTIANANGTFTITAQHYEPTWISPFLKATHNCSEHQPNPFSTRCYFETKLTLKHAEMADPDTYQYEAHSLEIVLFTDRELIVCN